MGTLSKEMKAKLQRTERLLSERLPDKIIQEAENLVDNSFRKEQYQDGKSSKWKARKNDPEAKKKRSDRRALLVKSGKLIGSTGAKRKGSDIVITAETYYAQVHNEGGQAGRGTGFTMEQRQFMPIEGEPFPAESKIDAWMDRELDKIFSN